LSGGNFTTSYTDYIARLNSDGTFDTSFNSGGSGTNGVVRDLDIQSDGKILIVGGFDSYNGTTGLNDIALLNSDGTLDTTFNSDVLANGSLISSIFDTQVTGGSAINTVMWQGTQPSGTNVFFQIASANCSNGATNPPTCSVDSGWGDPKTSGDGAFVGPDGTSNSFYNPGNPNVQSEVNLAYHNNKRYWRYKVVLVPSANSPTVTDIIINWSP
jgi:hypothetical protein